MVKKPPVSAGDRRDVDSVPGLERSPGGGNGNPLQCSGESKGQGSQVGYSPWCRMHALFHSMVLRFHRLLGTNESIWPC